MFLAFPRSDKIFFVFVSVSHPQFLLPIVIYINCSTLLKYQKLSDLLKIMPPNI